MTEGVSAIRAMQAHAQAMEERAHIAEANAQAAQAVNTMLLSQVEAGGALGDYAPETAAEQALFEAWERFQASADSCRQALVMLMAVRDS